MPLPYAVNEKSTTNSVNDILEIPYHSNLKLVSLDIINMYTIVPLNELLVTIKFMYKQNNTGK